MTPAKLKEYQDQWNSARKTWEPNQISTEQKQILKSFVKERIQNERATATRS